MDQSKNLIEFFQNIFVTTEYDKETLKEYNTINIIKNLLEHQKSDAKTILESQLIPFDSINKLFSGNYEEFLHDRANFMLNKAIEVTS